VTAKTQIVLAPACLRQIPDCGIFLPVKKWNMDALVTRQDLVKIYGISKAEVNRALRNVRPDEGYNKRRHGWQHYWTGCKYKRTNPAVVELLGPTPIETMHEEYDYNE
jgi:hypothetical protein